MNKDDILSKSRSENKDRDLYAEEIGSTAGAVSSLVALILATVFFIVQVVLGQGFDFGLYAILFSVGAVNFIFKAVHMKRKKDIALSFIYGLATVVLTGIHIYTIASAAMQ